MKKQTVDCQQAAECMFELFKEKQWLISEKPVAHTESEIEQAAVSFLLALAEHKTDNWNDTHQSVRETVTLLLTDFMAKLMSPNSPFTQYSWQVNPTYSMAQKALEIVAHEIRQNYHPLARLH